MKEYLDPKKGLESKAEDALRAEAEWDKDNLKDFFNVNSIDGDFLKQLDNSYVALGVYVRFRRIYDDFQILNDVRVFYKNFKNAIDEKEYLSGEGILRFARAAFAVWYVFVNDCRLAYSPEERIRQKVDERIMNEMTPDVFPSHVEVTKGIFDSSIRTGLARLGYRRKVDFNPNEPLVCLVERLLE